jgi:hypothetical protein
LKLPFCRINILFLNYFIELRLKIYLHKSLEKVFWISLSIELSKPFKYKSTDESCILLKKSAIFLKSSWLKKSYPKEKIWDNIFFSSCKVLTIERHSYIVVSTEVGKPDFFRVTYSFFSLIFFYFNFYYCSTSKFYSI